MLKEPFLQPIQHRRIRTRAVYGMASSPQGAPLFFNRLRPEQVWPSAAAIDRSPFDFKSARDTHSCRDLLATLTKKKDTMLSVELTTR